MTHTVYRFFDRLILIPNIEEQIVNREEVVYNKFTLE